MKKSAIKICSVLLISVLVLGAAYLTGFDFDGISKVFAAQSDSSCKIYREAQYVGGGTTGTWWAYEDYTLTLQGETFEGIRVIDYHGPYNPDIVIPDSVDGKTVISVCFIGDCVYSEEKCGSISTVTLPSTLKEIGEYAFNGMTLLESVSISADVEKIGGYAFQGCTSLKSVIFNEGEGNGLTEIGECGFHGCSALASIELPDTLTVIGKSAFMGCKALTSIDLPDSLRTLGENAFASCTKLSQVNFNEGLETIDKYAFYYCNLKNVELKEGLASINAYAFSGNYNLVTIKLPEGLTYIGDGFLSNTLVEEIDLPDSLKSSGTFIDGSRIKELVLPPGFSDVKYNSISSDVKLNYLESLTIQDSSVSYIRFENLKTLILKGNCQIADDPFYGVRTEIYYHGTNTWEVYTTKYPPETIIFTDNINSNVHDLLINTHNYNLHTDPETGYYVYSKVNIGDADFVLQGNSFTSSDYIYDTTSGGGAVITDYVGTETGVLNVPDSFENEGVTYPVVAIGRNAFEEATATEINLPETVEKIGIYAFYNCKYLTKSNLPEGIKVIEPYTYAGCKSMSEITIPDSVVYIGERAFNLCNASELVIPSSVKSIGANAFYNNYYLTSLTLNEGLEKIGEGAFRNGETPYTYEYIKEYSLTLPSTVKEIGERAFEYSGVSGEVVIPESLTKIPGSMFFGSDFLTSIVMHGGITEIGASAFRECYNLSSAPLLSGLETVGDYAFCNSGLTSLTIPTTVTSLGKFAFCNTLITAVTVPANIKTVPEHCFFQCYELKNVTLANGVEYIETYAFAHSGPYERFVIPPSVVGINSYAFYCVERIENFVFNATCYESDLTYDEDNETGRFSFILNSRKSIQIGKLTIGGSVKYVPADLAYNAKIEEVVLPSNIIGIGKSAFDICTIGKALVIPNSVKAVYEYAFYGLTIPEITLPENLETVEELAFYEIEAETLYYNCKNCSFEIYPYDIGIEGIYESPFYSDGLKNFVIGENVETLPDFTFCGISGLETVHIPDNITSLSKGAFAQSGVKTVTGMSSITKLEDYMFYQSDITSLDVENSKIKRAGKYAFAYSGIETLNSLEGLTQIEDYAFYECLNLTQIDLTNFKVTDIGYFSFANSGLTSFNGGALLESVGDSSFVSCTSLANLDLGTKIMLIGNGAFEGCTALKNLIVPDTVKNISDRAFANCTALETVCMSVNVDFIPTECFYNDAALSSFTWDAESKLIGRLAFGNCTSLNEFNFIGIEKLYESSFYNSGVKVVSLGEALDNANAALEKIEASSFQACTELETVSIGGNVSTVSTLAFAGCSNLETALISDNVTEIADDAFDDCPNLTFVCSPTSYAYSYASANGIPVSTLVISAIPNQVYTGYAIKPSVTVTVTNSTLTKNVDYSVTYSNNVNVGTATVKVQGMGDYEMFSSKANFTIVTRNISKAQISEIKDQKYTGKAIKPTLTVTDNGRYLKEGKDYNVYYYNNTSKGTAYVSIAGKGNYSGSQRTTFEIKELDAGEEIMNWFLGFMTDFFAKFVSMFLTIGNK